MATRTSASGLEKAIASGRFVLTAEVTPPVSCDRNDLLAKAMPLKGLADAVNVTDGAGARAHLGAMAAAIILHQNAIEPVLQLTCRGCVATIRAPALSRTQIRCSISTPVR